MDISGELLRLREGEPGGFINYSVGKREKTAYIDIEPSLGWIIGSGFYRDGADSYLDDQTTLWEHFSRDIRKALFLRLSIFALVLFSFTVIASFLLKRSNSRQIRLLKEFTLFKETLNDNLCVIHANPRGFITDVNHMYCSLTGYDHKTRKGDYFNKDFHPSNREKLTREIKEALAEDNVWNGILKGKNREGDTFWLQAQIKQIFDENGILTGHIAVGFDITELRLTKNTLKESLYIDLLTGCGSRAKLLSDYDKAGEACIAYFNIDRFASINHFHGMDRGDEVLAQIGKTLTSLLRGGETLYRIHSDTFVILYAGNDKTAFIENCRNRMFVLNNITFDFNDVQFPLSIRCGISVSSADSLIIADSALSVTKESSDGFVVFGDSELEDSRYKLDKISQLNRLRLALSDSNLFLTYQPIMDLATGETSKYECLIRMKDEEGRIISPGNFIELAKEGRLYKKITHYVIRKAFYMFQNRKDEFSINLTIEDFTDRDTIDLLIEQARLCQVQDRLILEIVETEELRDFGGILKIINRLKAEGIRIAIDDFGAGFSNFNYLLQLSVDFIKIDGSLVKNILNDENSLSLVRSIIQFARQAGIKTIAEYIESEELNDFAAEIGIDFGQGYHIGKPGHLP